ncbi:cell division protein FtsA [Alkalibacillus aidingensis]|uniref:cell division protein FtsA n=1 Tax=Alkalibacillus aidingensis TaxID=2747607 RepID=UPI0016603D4D|nr:cell division protein FtsA [Alkalibacillus aidingensis]
MTDQLFALDIGTRSIVGIILRKADDHYQVIDMVAKEHRERSMLDGQIHNVLAVSKLIQEVKEELECKHGSLTHVCVAAAGRALKTKTSTVEVDIATQPLMNEDDIFHLELAAVQEAQYQLAEEEQGDSSTQYYCVGYSVLHYYLDDQKIGSLIDQQGETAKVDIIATFLPKVVVESLLSALQRADLEMEALTLEPIAAIQVLIPPSMRRLNVALVDIGAGTSDIAITNKGTVTAYGMVPKAGDEITEAISEQYLLDFHQAEEAKKQLVRDYSMEIEDILGFKSEVTIEQVTEDIRDSIDQLAEAICKKILHLNNQSPKAVMLVGGGSLTPNLTSSIATKLQLPDQRVAVRGIDAIQGLKGHDQLPMSPEFVTPIGIAIAAKKSPVHYISVEVNDRMVRLFDVKQLTIGDCLLAAGLELKKLYGKPGMAMMVYFNSRKITLPGTYGKAPTIKVNGKAASIQDPIKHGDKIEVIPGIDGETPSYTVKDVVGEQQGKTIWVIDQKVQADSLIKVNDQPTHLDHQLLDGDHISWSNVVTVRSFLENNGFQHVIEQMKPFEITYNNQPLTIFQQQVDLTLNDQKTTLDQTLEDGDQLSYQLFRYITLDQLAERLDLVLYTNLTIFFNNQPVDITKWSYDIKRNGQSLNPDDIIYPNDDIKIKPKDSEPFIFQDIFRFVEFDLDEVKGKRFKLYRNDEEVGFSAPIQEGDQLKIAWISHV